MRIFKSSRLCLPFHRFDSVEEETRAESTRVTGPRLCVQGVVVWTPGAGST